MGNGEQMNGVMNRSKKRAGIWRTLRLWLPSVLMFCVVAGTMLSIFLSLRATVWCYFTDDVSVRENALDTRVRMVLWEEPYRAPGEVGKLCDSHGLAFSPNGGTVVFGQNVVGQAGGSTNMDLFVSEWNGRAWNKPVALDSVNTEFNEKDPAFSPDGKYLYFSSDRPGGVGGYDIWVARWDGLKWAGITNAGPAINSIDDEVAPAVYPDGRRLYFSSNRSGLKKGNHATCFDIFVSDVTVNAPVATNDASASGQAVTNTVVKQKTTGSVRAVEKSKALKGKPGKFPPMERTTWGTNSVNAAKAGEPAIVPEFGNVSREERINSQADDLYISFSPGRDFAYFASNRKGGSGGFDIYCSRIVDGNLLSPANLGCEINSTGDDTSPAVRMNGYDILFSSSRDSAQAKLFASTAREVTCCLDLSRLDSLIANFLDAKWWILAFIVALAVLVYLVRHYKDLTNLYHKCLMVSAIVHMILVVVVSFWKISEKMVEPDEGRQKTKVEFTLNVDNLANEKLALNMAEDVTKLPASDVTVIARPANAFMPIADFVPQEKSVQTVVARSAMEPVQLESAPSKPSELAAEKVEANKIAPAPDKMDKLPEMQMPGAEVVMEVRQPSAIVETKPAEEFQPVMNVPAISAERSDKPWARPATNLSPIHVAAGVEAVPAATGSVVGVTSLSGDGLVSTRDTGGNVARLSRGDTDVSTGSSELKGPGETISMRLASTGNDDVFKINAFGKLDVPEGFSPKMNPYMLRKGGKQSDQVVEGLGGSGVTEAAVERSLNWFKQAQEPDGHWSIQKYGGLAGHDSAASGLALLCYMGWGCKHNEPGKYQATVARAVDWLTRQVKNDGNMMGQGNMYDQGIATLALTEAYGLTKDAKLLASITNAVGFIVRAQNKNTGGWRYKPGEGGDTSVFGWQLMALKSARVAGIDVPQESFDLADKWLTSVGGGEQGGLYGYTGKDHSPAMAAEAMFCRQLLSTEATHPAMHETANYLNTSLPKKAQVNFYYWYYGSLSLHQHQGQIWEDWNAKMKEILVSSQIIIGENTGTWDPSGAHGNEMGRVVGSAMATLTLEVYYRYLPITAGDARKSDAKNEKIAAPKDAKSTGAEKRATERKKSVNKAR